MLMNFGMGASPTAWTPDRQTSQAVQTPDEMRQQFQAQMAARGPAPSAGNIGPGRDDIMADYAQQMGQAEAAWGGFDPNQMAASEANILKNVTPTTDYFLPDFVAKWNAAPAGSTWGAIQDANAGAAAYAAQGAAAQNAFNQKLANYTQAQQTNQNAYGQQTGFGVTGGILPRAQPQPGIDPMAVGAGAQAGPVAPITPTWGGWSGMSLPQGYTGTLGAPGGLGGLGGMGGMGPQPSAALGGPFAQNNPWSPA